MEERWYDEEVGSLFAEKPKRSKEECWPAFETEPAKKMVKLVSGRQHQDLIGHLLISFGASLYLSIECPGAK